MTRIDVGKKWLCTRIKTAPLSGRARRGKHCALAVVLILFFQRLSVSARRDGVWIVRRGVGVSAG
ncbi:TPA: hypothetical protein ACHIXJ_RS24635, partial [Escherichia coli]